MSSVLSNKINALSSVNDFDSLRAHPLSTDVKSIVRLREKWAETLTELTQLAEILPKQKLIKIITIFSEARKKRFQRRENKGRNINRGFTDEELERFFQAIKNKQHALFFLYQAEMGLRVGEVCNLKVSDISYNNRMLRIESEKSRKIDYLRIPPTLFELTLGYINKNRIQGRLFPKEPNGMRVRFREYSIRAGLHDVYAHDTKGHRLHRLSTHSLRHYAITRFYALTKDIVKTQKFARHSRLETTQVYIHMRMDEVNEAIDFLELERPCHMRASLGRQGQS